MRRSHNLRPVLGGLIAALALGACASPTPKSLDGGTLVYAVDSDVATLNPFEAADPASVRAVQFLFPNLYAVDRNLAVVPDLASAMPTISADGTVWTVPLRPAARWSDQTSITAQDVVNTVNIQGNPDLDTDATSSWGVMKSVAALDAHTVQFTLRQPFAPFLANNLVGFVAPSAVYGRIDVKTMRTDPTNQAPTVTGGPFLFSRWVPGAEVDLRANPRYIHGRPHLDGLVLKAIRDPAEAVAALNAGTVQAIAALPGAAASQVDAKRSRVFTYPDLGYFDVRFNDRPGRVFGDVAVRQAFAYAIDHDQLVLAATGRGATPVHGDIPLDSWAYNPAAAVRYPRNLERARQLLAVAGWTPGPDGVLVKAGKRFSVDFCVRSGKPEREKAVSLISASVRAVGMELKPRPLDFGVFYRGTARGGCGIETAEFDIALAGWGLSLDPDDYSLLSPRTIAPEVDRLGENWTGYQDEELARLMDQERAVYQPTEAQARAVRRPIFDRIEAILTTNVATYFLWSTNDLQAFARKVGGVAGGGRAGLDLTYLDADRNGAAWAALYLVP